MLYLPPAGVMPNQPPLSQTAAPMTTSLPPFPVDALPPKITLLVRELQAVTGASASVITGAVLLATATAMQQRFHIVHSDRTVTRPQLFVVSVDDTGKTKDDVLNHVFRALHYRQIGINLHHQGLLEKIESKRGQFLQNLEEFLRAHNPPPLEERIDSLLKAAHGLHTEPRRPQLIYDTPMPKETLRAIQAQGKLAVLINPRANAMFSLASLKRLDQLVFAWKAPELAPAPSSPKSISNTSRLCAYLSVTSQALMRHAKNKDTSGHGQEFIYRSLFTGSAVELNTTVNASPPGSRQSLPSLFTNVLLALFKDTSSAEISISPEQEKYLKTLQENLINKISPAFHSTELYTYISYQKDNLVRLALVLHVLENGLPQYPGNHSLIHTPIIQETLSRAEALISWHIQVYVSLFDPGYPLISTAQISAQKLLGWLNKQLNGRRPNEMTEAKLVYPTLFRRTTIRQCGPLRTSAELSVALDELSRQGYISETIDGRTRWVTYPVSPGYLWY